MIFGNTGPQMDAAHWLVLTQGLLMLVALVPLLAVVATRARHRRPPLLAPRLVAVRVPQLRTGHDGQDRSEHGARERTSHGEIR